MATTESLPEPLDNTAGHQTSILGVQNNAGCHAHKASSMDNEKIVRVETSAALQEENPALYNMYSN